MFPHKDNLESKIRNDYKGAERFLRRFYNKYYIPWHKANLKIRGASVGHIRKKVNLLNKYYAKVDRIIEKGPSGKRSGWLTSQSKFRPTVLEEFCYYLLKDLREIKRFKLVFVKKGIHAGFRLDSRGKISTIKKDVDCCIAKEEEGQIGKEEIEFIIPVISIECKTYLDGTMWNESQYTAILLKRANPTSKVYVFTEQNQVDIDKITKESPVNEIFVIKKSRSHNVDVAAVEDFVQQVKIDLGEIFTRDRKFVKGRLINR